MFKVFTSNILLLTNINIKMVVKKVKTIKKKTLRCLSKFFMYNLTKKSE